MHETQEQLSELGDIIRRSADTAGAFLRNAFEVPAKSLTAQELAEQLEGFFTIALAVGTSDGRPIVSPVGCLLWNGRFVVPTVASSVKARLASRRPEVSFTHHTESDFAVLVQGIATVIPAADPAARPYDDHLIERHGEGTNDWGEKNEGVYLSIVPNRIVTYRSGKTDESQSEGAV